MKKIFASSVALCAAALSAAAEDFYFTGEGTPTTSNPSGAWSTLVDGSLVPATHPPFEGEDNLVFDGQYVKSSELYVTIADNYGNDMSVNKLSRDIRVMAGREVSGQDVYWTLSGKVSVIGVEGVYEGGGKFTDNSKLLTFSYTSDSVDETLGAPRIHFSADSIEVMADGTTASDNMTHRARLSLGTATMPLKTITINNGVALYSRTELQLSAETVKIGGIVSLNAKNWENTAKIKVGSSGASSRVEIGGLTSNGECAEICNSADAEGTSTTIVFKNAAGVDCLYLGKIMDGRYGAGESYHLSKLNIEMDGEGIQRLSAQDPAQCFYTGTVTVKRGTLYVDNKMGAGDTYLEGGRLGIIYSNRTFKTSGFHWSGGILELDVKDGVTEELIIDGVLEKVGDGKLVFALNLTEGDYDAIALGSSAKYDLLTAESLSNFGDSLDDDFEIFGMDKSKFDANFLFADNTLSVVITHVPEPAAFAAVFGIAAAAIAAARRRK
ncbi:MAG: hypothetical protein J6J65_06135 [Opitutales bacterium]|nr:hypothetical protein [Opitutales bacterium]